MSTATTPQHAAVNGATRYPGALVSGATGKPVRVLQERLNRHGYTLGIDGEFGPATLGAVRQFQADHGLEVDGAVGPETWRKLWLKPRAPRGLGERAFRVATGLVGVMEIGGNNQG